MDLKLLHSKQLEDKPLTTRHTVKKYIRGESQNISSVDIFPVNCTLVGNASGDPPSTFQRSHHASHCGWRYSLKSFPLKKFTIPSEVIHGAFPVKLRECMILYAFNKKDKSKKSCSLVYDVYGHDVVSKRHRIKKTPRDHTPS